MEHDTQNGNNLSLGRVPAGMWGSGFGMLASVPTSWLSSVALGANTWCGIGRSHSHTQHTAYLSRFGSGAHGRSGLRHASADGLGCTGSVATRDALPAQVLP